MHVGACFDDDAMCVTPGKDFYCLLSFEDKNKAPVDIRSGSLFFEFDGGAKWVFKIQGSKAFVTQVVEGVSNRERWRLVFLPAGQVSGGKVLANGYVRFQK